MSRLTISLTPHIRACPLATQTSRIWKILEKRRETNESPAFKSQKINYAAETPFPYAALTRNEKMEDVIETNGNSPEIARKYKMPSR